MGFGGGLAAPFLRSRVAQGANSSQDFLKKFRAWVFDTHCGHSYPALPDGGSSAEGLYDFYS